MKKKKQEKSTVVKPNMANTEKTNDVPQNSNEAFSEEMHEGLKELAGRIENEKWQFEEKVQSLEAEGRALKQEINAREQEIRTTTEQYEKEIRELKQQIEDESERYIELQKSFQEEQNASKIAMVNKETEIKSEYEKKIHGLEMANMSVDEELNELKVRRDEERRDIAEKISQNEAIIKEKTERFMARNDELKGDIQRKDNEFKNMEERSGRERRELKEQINLQEAQIQALQVEVAEARADLKSEIQKNERNIEKMKSEIMGQALKELEKGLVSEREQWRKKLKVEVDEAERKEDTES